MSMTPDEAKTKWCPLAVVAEATPSGVSTGRPSFNRVDTGSGFIQHPVNSHCLAAGCMAWRWTEEMVPREEQTQFIRPGTVRKSSTHGHCGLAGPG